MIRKNTLLNEVRENFNSKQGRRKRSQLRAPRRDYDNGRRIQRVLTKLTTGEAIIIRRVEKEDSRLHELRNKGSRRGLEDLSLPITVIKGLVGTWFTIQLTVKTVTSLWGLERGLVDRDQEDRVVGSFRTRIWFLHLLENFLISFFTVPCFHLDPIWSGI